MRASRLLLSLIAAALLAAGCGDDGDEPAATPRATTAAEPAETTETETAAPEGRTIEVELADLEGSGQSGTATLTELGENRTRVAIELHGTPGGLQPADVREGSCDRITNEPGFELTPLADGRSESEIDVGLTTLQESDYVLVVQRSEQEPDAHVACGYLAAV
jgi:hypothetical protein